MAKEPATVPIPPLPPFSTAILDTLADGVLITDRDYTITYANRAAAPPAVVGRKCHEVSHQYPFPCDADCLRETHCPNRLVLASGRPAFLRHRHPQPDGTTRTFSITASPITDGAGEIRQVIQVLKDVTGEEAILQEHQLRRREVEDVFSNSPNSIAYLDREQRVVRVNPAMEALTGIPGGEAVGRHCWDLWGQYADDPTKTDAARRCDDCGVRLALADGRKHGYQRRLGDRTIEILAVPVRDSRGEAIIGALEIGRDVTDQKRTEAALQESLARYRNLFEESPLPLVVADFSAIKASLAGFGFSPPADIAAYCTSHPDIVAALLQQLRLIDFNLAALRLLGIPGKDQAFANLGHILAGIPLHETPEGLVAIARGEVQSSHPFSIRTMGGANLSCTVHWQVEPGYEHSFGRVLLSLVDHTDRLHAEAELRLLRGRLHDAAENERRRLARELHDDVGQKLAALGINLQLLRNTRGVTDPERFQARLDDSVQMIEEMVGQVRSVMTELRPPLLDDYGLLACLKWLGGRFADRTEIAITVTGEEPRPRLAPARETAIYRIAQEALTNAVRHSGARRISLSLQETGDSLLLRVEDDGRGFVPAATPGRYPDAGLGLVGMRERAELLPAGLTIDSAPGKGTTVTLRVRR